MIDILKGLFDPVTKVVEGWQERKTISAQTKAEVQKLESEVLLLQAKARVEAARQGQKIDYDLDLISLKNMQKSWKDELVLLVFLAPLIMAFVPGWQQHALLGFETIAKMPQWYVAIVIGMVVVIYGLRGLLTRFLQAQKGKLF